MFFILSKILYFLLLPLVWVLILLIWRALSKSQQIRKRIGITIVSILVVFTNPLIYNWVCLSWQPYPVTLKPGTKYEAGIMLGGLSEYDKFGRGYFSGAADRFIQTANLYHQGYIKKIIVTGGTGSLNQDELGEAPFLLKELIANGVKDTDIIIDNKSRNTYENAVYSKQILDSMKLAPPYILITSGYHMKRSESVFKKAGIPCISFPCDYKVVPKDYDANRIIIPNVKYLADWPYIIKEMIGLLAYQLTGKA